MLNINLATELVPVRNVLNVDGLCRILGCRVSSLPMKYLDLSVLRSRPNLSGIQLLRKWKED